jgi:Flp pilus assembly protein TadB
VLKFLFVVVLIAGVVYALMWTIERRRAAGSGTEREVVRRTSRPTTKSVAPDDDEDFLRWLDRKRRKDSPDS